jgi:hypothetical protein
MCRGVLSRTLRFVDTGTDAAAPPHFPFQCPLIGSISHDDAGFARVLCGINWSDRAYCKQVLLTSRNPLRSCPFGERRRAIRAMRG